MAEFYASHPLPGAEPTIQDVLTRMRDLVTRIGAQAQHVGALSADLDRRPEVVSQAKTLYELGEAFKAEGRAVAGWLVKTKAMSASEVGRLFGVSHTAVLNWAQSDTRRLLCGIVDSIAADVEGTSVPAPGRASQARGE